MFFVPYIFGVGIGIGLFFRYKKLIENIDLDNEIKFLKKT